MVKNSPANAGDIRYVGSILGMGRSLGEGHDNPLQCSYLENPMNRGSWRAIAHRVAKSQTWLKRLSTHTLSYLEASFWPSVLNVDALLLSTASHTGAIMPLWEVLQWKHLVMQPSHSSGPFWKLGPDLWKTIFPVRGVEDSFEMIQVHYIYCVLYFYHYCISSNSDQQASDPGGWGPLGYRLGIPGP